MSKNNEVEIAGRITEKPKLIVDADDGAKREYEMTLTRMRPSKTEDTYTVRFPGRAIQPGKMLEDFAEDVEVLACGEIRSENVSDPQPGETGTKVYIYADTIVVNDEPTENQNSVKLCGNICLLPRFRKTNRRTDNGRRMNVTSIIVAVNTPNNTSYIPCKCFGWMALSASTLKIGDYVEVCGRFQSRDYKKRIPDRSVPYLQTVHEVCVTKLEGCGDKGNKVEAEGGNGQ